MPHIQATGFYRVMYDYSRALIVTSRGDGSKCASFSVKVAAGATFILDGTALFYDNWDGTGTGTDTWTPTPGSLQTKYVKCPSGTANLVMNDPDLLLGFGHTMSATSGNPSWAYKTTDSTYLANTPSLTLNNWNYPNCTDVYLIYGTILIMSIALSQLSPNLLYFSSYAGGTITGSVTDIGGVCEIFSLNQTTTFSGNISDIPTSMKQFQVGGSNTLTGDITNLQEGLTFFSVTGNNTISGDIVNLPSTLATISVFGNNTITGDIANFSSVLTNITIGGLNTISGDIQDIKSTVTNINIAGNSTIGGDLDYWPSDSVIANMTIAGSNTITGGFTTLPDTLRYFSISGVNTINGLVEDIPALTTYINIIGNNTVGGSLNNLPSDSTLVTLIILGNNTITGDIAFLSNSVTTIYLSGGNTIYGDLNDLPANILYIQLLGDNAISNYTPPSGGRTWKSLALSSTAFNFQPASAGGLSSAEVDELIIDLDTSTTSSSATAKTIYITGSNEPRTSASDAAVASLLAHNITVVTN